MLNTDPSGKVSSNTVASPFSQIESMLLHINLNNIYNLLPAGNACFTKIDSPLPESKLSNISYSSASAAENDTLYQQFGIKIRDVDWPTNYIRIKVAMWEVLMDIGRTARWPNHETVTGLSNGFLKTFRENKPNAHIGIIDGGPSFRSECDGIFFGDQVGMDLVMESNPLERGIKLYSKAVENPLVLKKTIVHEMTHVRDGLTSYALSGNFMNATKGIYKPTNNKCEHSGVLGHEQEKYIPGPVGLSVSDYAASSHREDLAESSAALIYPTMFARPLNQFTQRHRFIRSMYKA